MPEESILERVINDILDKQDQVKITDKAIVFTVENASYEIRLGQCNSHQRILYWVTHLLEKSWVTPQMVTSFVWLACWHHKLPFQEFD